MSRNDVCPCCPLENQTQPYPLNQEDVDLFHMVLFPSRFRNIRNLTPNLLSDAYDKIVSMDVATFYEEQCSKIKQIDCCRRVWCARKSTILFIDVSKNGNYNLILTQSGRYVAKLTSS